MLNLSKEANLDDVGLMRDYMMQKGVPLLDCVAEQLDKMHKPFDNQHSSIIHDVDNSGGSHGYQLEASHLKGEKFNEHHDNDFQEWEQYDIVHVKDPRNTSTIALQHVPQYIQQDVQMGVSYQRIQYNYISEIKSGIKLGRKFSDQDERWGEKWFEIRCKEANVNDQQIVNVIIKFYSKFWTKSEIIEGECCHQVLLDGSQQYKHDGLIYELKDFYNFDNISVRKNKK